MKNYFLLYLVCLLGLTACQKEEINTIFERDIAIYNNETLVETQQALEGVKIIDGSVYLTYDSISSLAFLKDIEEIKGNLEITHGSFTSLEGLENLKSVKQLVIWGYNLKDASQLANIRVQTHLQLEHFNRLTELPPIKIGSEEGNLSSLSLKDNDSLEKVTFEEGSKIEQYLEIGNNPLLEFISFTDLEEVSSLNYYGNALRNFEGLKQLRSVTSEFKITANNQLESFMGLEQFNQIGGDVYISLNNVLSSLEGLNNLKVDLITPELNTLIINDNDQLSNFCALKELALQNKAGSFTIDERRLKLKGADGQLLTLDKIIEDCR